ncbi:hypothetical protein FGB62_283g02 [Gracilaria domingensis]|nr:hypothetical protein FGB62_283g02 [Gracilaria domingensis]
MIIVIALQMQSVLREERGIPVGKKGHIAGNCPDKMTSFGNRSIVRHVDYATNSVNQARVLTARYYSMEEASKIVLDSGALQHVMNDSRCLFDIRNVSSKTVLLRDSRVLHASFEGLAVLRCTIRVEEDVFERDVHLENVL